jgi:pyruvate decarboxylase
MVTLSRQQVQLVEYLFQRLSQLGIKAVHGVPGDFNIVTLDYIHDAGLEWVGDANELNAGMSLISLALH